MTMLIVTCGAKPPSCWLQLPEQRDGEEQDEELQETASNPGLRSETSKKRSPYRTSVSGDALEESAPLAAPASPPAAAGQSRLLEAQNSGRTSVPPSELFRCSAAVMCCCAMQMHSAVAR